MSPQSKNEAAIGILKWLAFYRALARLTSLRSQTRDPGARSIRPIWKCSTMSFGFSPRSKNEMHPFLLRPESHYGIIFGDRVIPHFLLRRWTQVFGHATIPATRKHLDSAEGS